MPVYEKQDKTKTKKAYYTGSDVLREGYALCYNNDSITGGSAGEFDGSRHWEVEKPASGNLKYFAGVVSGSYANKTGPCVVKLHEPDSACRGVNLWTQLSTTLGTTKLALIGGTYAFGAVGNTRITMGTAMQTEDRSTTAGVVQALYGRAERTAFITSATPTLTGGTSGGTALVSYTATAPSITGGTTGGSTTIAGTSAQMLEDTLRLADAVEALKVDSTALSVLILRNTGAMANVKTDITAVLNLLKKQNQMDMS